MRKFNYILALLCLIAAIIQLSRGYYGLSVLDSCVMLSNFYWCVR